MCYSPNSLKGIIWGTTIGLIKGDTRSLDYSSYKGSGEENGNYNPWFRVKGLG